MKNIKFHKVRNDFQIKLHEDLRKVRSLKKTLTFADKTSNMCRLEKEEYRRLLQNAVTTTYKKSNKETERRINCKGIKYAHEANILDKQILDQINSKLCEILKLNEWKNTASLIFWFKKIESKSSHKFLFDIKDFYPSIKEGLLIEALEFPKQHVIINSKDRETIFHARKSLLYKEGEPWIKKQSNNFNVAMGSYDGAELCELVGIFMLS